MVLELMRLVTGSPAVEGCAFDYVRRREASLAVAALLELTYLVAFQRAC